MRYFQVSFEGCTWWRATAAFCIALLASCGGGGEASSKADDRFRPLAASSEIAALLTNPAAVTITGIAGYGTNSPTFLAGGPTSVPINNDGLVAIRSYESDSFKLTADGMNYTTVASGGPGTLWSDGFALNDAATLFFFNRSAQAGTPEVFQFFRRAAPYTDLEPYSPICQCYTHDLAVNSAGKGVALVRTSDLNVPSLQRFNGDGSVQTLAIPTPDYFSDDGTFSRPRITSDGSIFIGVINRSVSGTPHQIWRFAPGQTTNTIAYAPANGSLILAWGINDDGSLVVVEANGAGALAEVKTVVGNVISAVPALVAAPTTAIQSVFINRAGMLAAVRTYNDGAGSSGHEIVFVPSPGAMPVRVLGSGDTLNAGVVTAMNALSEMNEAGQFTTLVFTDISPQPFPNQQVVAIVTPLFPSIASFTPASGSSDGAITITGKHFSGATEVLFNGSPATFTVNSGTQITATVPSAATTGPITVTTGAGSATSATTFTVVPPLPTIGGFSPASGPVGSAVTITGTHFTGATAVSFNGAAAAFTVASDTEIAASVPSGATSGPIGVTTLAGSAASATGFTVTSPLAPVIASVSPAAAGIGGGVTIKGGNLGGASSVTFNGVAAAFKLKGSGQITTTVPVGASSGPLGVTTAAGAASVDFVVLPVPQIGSISPLSGAPGAQVTIAGANFSDVTAVAFGGAKAMTFTVVSGTTIVATVPKGAKTGPVTVVTVAGFASSADAFQVVK